ncbi:RidA family protein [Acerihabitans arboris]|uniref:RidA family protein n=1 Tax=Acerihabitans arboris TaxID=2691583 RepID=A0A845SGM8_9GAMM|nr:RidA family protein [Acerihabitans arboris]NDL62104.1 RidA family protein [Acerihabitans arboris]
MRIISVPDLPPPAGHYSQAVVARGWVFISGVLPSPDCFDAEFDIQLGSVLDICGKILAEAGCSWQHVVQCTAYIAGVEYWPNFNSIYARYLKEHQPARVVVPVAALHHGCLVEVQLTATATQSQSKPSLPETRRSS